jgi:hypothetical protein
MNDETDSSATYFWSSEKLITEACEKIQDETSDIDKNIVTLRKEHTKEHEILLERNSYFSRALTHIKRYVDDVRVFLGQALVTEQLSIYPRDSDSAANNIARVRSVVTPSSTPSDDNKRNNIVIDERSSVSATESDTMSEWDAFDRNWGNCADNYIQGLKKMSELLTSRHEACLQWLNKSEMDECALNKANMEELSQLRNDVSIQLKQLEQKHESLKESITILHKFLENEQLISTQRSEALSYEVCNFDWHCDV